MNLFEHADTYPHKAGFKDQSTSRDAAIAVEATGRAAHNRALILGWFKAGNAGTADDAGVAVGLDGFQARPRVSELYKQGLIDRTGLRERCNGGRGRWAHVMVAA
jgi:predicted ArsR family transcriptional regulator